MKITLKGAAIILLAISYFTPKGAIAQPANTPEFVRPPELVRDPASLYNYSTDSRRFSGIPSLTIDRDGNFWAVWYAGPSPAEDNNNYVVVATSGDSGRTWREVLAIDPDGPGSVRAFDPEVWVDPNGRLWVFWAQGNNGEIPVEHDGFIAGVWAITARGRGNGDLNWSSPRRLTDGIMMCKPTVLSSGEWTLPVSIWMNSEQSARAVVSTDRGSSWSTRGSAHVPKEVRTYDEPMIVELEDGTLLMLVRTLYGIGESISRDRGRTWSDVQPSGLQHPSARFFLRRLRSGNLLLVKHGPVDLKTGRSHLMAFISRDDGRSWSHGLLLDQRPGVSYPDGRQAEDGTIYVTYDFSRTGAQQILMTSFTEEEVLSDKYDENIVKVFERRKVISDGGRE